MYLFVKRGWCRNAYRLHWTQLGNSFLRLERVKKALKEVGGLPESDEEVGHSLIIRLPDTREEG